STPKTIRARATTPAPNRASLRRSDTLVAQRVASPAHRVQDAGLSELVAQVPDVHRDHVVAVDLALPHRIDQLLARQHLARVAEKMPQQVKLGGGQLEGVVAPPRRPGRGLEPEIGEREMVGWRGPPEQGAHTREQLL